MEIKYPDNAAKEKSIENIILKTKKKYTDPLSFLLKSYRDIGFFAIFKNTLGAYLISSFIYLIVIRLLLDQCLTLITDSHIKLNMYCVFFVSSPFIIMFSNFLYMLAEVPADIECKGVCKYNARQIELIKMPFISIVSIVINSLSALLWCFTSGYSDVFGMLGVSATGILVYGIMNIEIYSRFRRYSGFIGAAIWLIINSALGLLDHTAKTVLFVGVPFAVHVIVVTVLAAVFMRAVQKSYYKLYAR